MNTLTCDLCGHDGATLRHIAESYGKGARLLVIENLPIVHCPHCHESYLTADTLRQVERLKRNRKRLAKRREVDVVKFG